MRSYGIALTLLAFGCGGSSGDPSSDTTPDDSQGGSSVGTSSGGSNSSGTLGNAGTTMIGTGPGGSAQGGAGGGSIGGGGRMGAGGSGGAGTGGSGGSGGSGEVGGSGGGPVIKPAVGCTSDQTPGTWVNVTPKTMKMTGDFIDGPIAANVDVVKPSDVYVQAQYDGTWKSMDCGATWTKVSKSTNSGRQWYATIDKNPNRDPSTSPTMYTTEGYGSGGIWKSTDGGVQWSNVWTNNIYKADGTTNISSDVGNDLSGVMIVDSSGPNHLIAFLHGYFGSGNNNGVFESTDGGGKWIVHVSPDLGFSAHADVVFPFNARTWIVGHGIGYPNSAMYRTTDGGGTFVRGADTLDAGSIGRDYLILGNTIYAGSDFTGGMFKSSDQGVTWKKLPKGSRVSWIVATATNLYASDAAGNGPPHILRAPLNDDGNWTDMGNPQGMNSAGSRGAVTYDGKHYVVIAAQEMGGLWRYVEP